jgi:hypothetical protein
MIQTFLMGPDFQLGPWVQFNWLTIIGRPLLKPFSSALDPDPKLSEKNLGRRRPNGGQRVCNQWGEGRREVFLRKKTPA